jgi:transcriptional regulator with XRE-family HTH domain
MGVYVNKKRLTFWMIRRGVTRPALAKAAGLSCPTISSVKSGRPCLPETAKKIAAALSVPLKALLKDGEAEKDGQGIEG